MKTNRNLLISMMAAVSLGMAGCQSFNGSPPGNLASVSISNRTMTDVQSAVAAVFVTHGFNGGQTGPNQFTYTRLGSRMNNLAYGSEMFDEIVTVKVVVTAQPQTPQTIVLSCKAWLIEGANDPVFQDSHQVRPLRKWPYEQLLKDIQSQLGQ
jgi:hypothetical protein